MSLNEKTSLTEQLSAVQNLVLSAPLAAGQEDEPLDFISKRLGKFLENSTMLASPRGASLADIARTRSLTVDLNIDMLDLAELAAWKRKAEQAGLPVQKIGSVRVATRSGDLSLLAQGGLQETVSRLEIQGLGMLMALVIPSLIGLSHLTVSLDKNVASLTVRISPDIHRLKHLEFQPSGETAIGRWEFPVIDAAHDLEVEECAVRRFTLPSDLPFSCGTLQLQDCVLPRNFRVRGLKALTVSGGFLDPTSALSLPGLQTLVLENLSLELASMGPWLDGIEGLTLSRVSAEEPVAFTLPSLRRLELNDVSSFKGLIDHAPDLEELSFTGNKTEGLKRWIHRMPKLRKLSIDGLSRREIIDLYASNGHRFSLTAKIVEEEIVVRGEEEYVHTDRFENGRWQRHSERRPPHRT